MLAKDIATIHNQPVGNINRIVNNNRKWFEDGIDVIDLKTNASDASVLQNTFTKAQWGNANNIYLFSERGYSMLVKFMSDEKACKFIERY